MGFQVRGGGNDNHAQRRGDGHRGHVFGNLITETDARVIPIRDDIRQPGINAHLDVDVGIFAL
ncbi:hypothetical protein D3C72_2356210 [compost metagenome]